MGILDMGVEKEIERIVKSGKLLCPFAIGSSNQGLGGLKGYKVVALQQSLQCGAWCKLYDNESKDCRLVHR